MKWCSQRSNASQCTDSQMKSSSAKTRRAAALLNLVVPGAGQFYLGQRLYGVVLAVLFLGSFVALLGLVVTGFSQYFSLITGGDVLEGNNLERIGAAFHLPWLVGCLVVATVVFLLSMVTLRPPAVADSEPAPSPSPEKPPVLR